MVNDTNGAATLQVSIVSAFGLSALLGIGKQLLDW